MRNKVLVGCALTAAAGAAAFLIYSRRGLRGSVRHPLTVQLSSLMGQQRRHVKARAAQTGAQQGELSVCPYEYPQVQADLLDVFGPTFLNHCDYKAESTAWPGKEG